MSTHARKLKASSDRHNVRQKVKKKTKIPLTIAVLTIGNLLIPSALRRNSGN